MRLEEVLDDDGSKFFSEEQLKALNEAEFFILQDLYFVNLNSSGYGYRIDSYAGRAKNVLKALEPQSNRVPMMLNELFEMWCASMKEQREQRKKLLSENAVPLTFTAPAGRASRMARGAFLRVSPDELPDLTCSGGKRRETDYGAVGLSTYPGDFGYNG